MEGARLSCDQCQKSEVAPMRTPAPTATWPILRLPASVLHWNMSSKNLWMNAERKWVLMSLPTLSWNCSLYRASCASQDRMKCSDSSWIAWSDLEWRDVLHFVDGWRHVILRQYLTLLWLRLSSSENPALLQYPLTLYRPSFSVHLWPLRCHVWEPKHRMPWKRDWSCGVSPWSIAEEPSSTRHSGYLGSGCHHHQSWKGNETCGPYRKHCKPWFCTASLLQVWTQWWDNCCAVVSWGSTWRWTWRQQGCE